MRRAVCARCGARRRACAAAEVIEHSSGVLDLEDVERLHDMRVATRRLRAALEIFAPCFPRKRLRATLKEVKAIADALGERRDRDVAIESLEDFAAQVGAADRIGVTALVETLRVEQRRANEDLAEYVSPARLAALDERLRDLVERAADLVTCPGARALKARKVKGLDPETPLRENAARISAPESPSCGRSPRRRWSRRPPRPSTTCGSPPSAFATCSR